MGSGLSGRFGSSLALRSLECPLLTLFTIKSVGWRNGIVWSSYFRGIQTEVVGSSPISIDSFCSVLLVDGSTWDAGPGSGESS